HRSCSHTAAAVDDPGHAHGIVGRTREGARFDHQLLRHARAPQRVRARQARALPDARHGELPVDDAVRRVRVRCADHRLVRLAGVRLVRVPAVCHRLRPAVLHLHAQPDGRDLHHHARHDDSGRAVRRPAQPRLLARRRRPLHRHHPADHLHVHHQPRRVRQGTGILRPARHAVAAAGRRAGDPGAVSRAVEEAGHVMNSLVNIYRLGVKELWGLWRDPIMLGLIVYAFTFSIYTAATAQPETLHRAPIAIVDEDRSPLSARIAMAFQAPHFTAPAMISPGAVDAGMDAGKFTFVLDIPPDFQRDVLAGRQPSIQLNIDATRMSQAFTGNGYIQQIVMGEVTEFLQRFRGESTPAVDLALRMRFNPELEQTWFGSITELIDMITMLSIVL